jgi:formylglycine-generating enzyme required for sulfatase activity
VDDPAKSDTNLRIQLSDFYLSQTLTITSQYLCFLAAVDYTTSGNDVKLSDSNIKGLLSLEYFTVGGSAKSLWSYYNIGSDLSSAYTTMRSATLCYGYTSNQTYFGYIQNSNGVLYSKEKTGSNGVVSDDNVGVCGVSWYGGMCYSHWLGGCLPSEAQWEFALRRTSLPFSGNNATGVSTGAYPYGSGVSGNAGDYGWYADNATGADADGTQTSDAGGYGTASTHNHNVGQKLGSPIGLYDMSGGLREWCADWYPGTAYNSVSSNYWYDAINGKLYLNPIYKASASSRVNRGGNWNSSLYYLRSGSRNFGTPGSRNGTIGFRACWGVLALSSLQ